jgi:hypothetical protein
MPRPWAARRGVFPLHYPVDGQCSCGDVACTSPAKHARTLHGLKDATTSPDAVAAWWFACPAANIARVTGVVDTTLDVDVTAGGDEALRGARGRTRATPADLARADRARGSRA